MHLKLTQKEGFKKQWKQLVIYIGNKIADKIARASKASPKNNLDTNEEEKILTETYVSQEQKNKDRILLMT